MSVNINDFAASHGVKANAVRQYIYRHPEIQALIQEAGEGEQQNGVSMILGDEAIELLEKKYPNPRPVEVVEDVETHRKLEAALAEINRLQKENADTRIALTKAQGELAAIEDKSSRLEAEKDKLSADAEDARNAAQKAQERAVKAETERDIIVEKANEQQSEIERLRDYTEKLQNRTLWQRITNKMPE